MLLVCPLLESRQRPSHKTCRFPTAVSRIPNTSNGSESVWTPGSPLLIDMSGQGCTPFNVNVRPTTVGSMLKCFVHILYAMTKTGGAPGLASSGMRPRP